MNIDMERILAKVEKREKPSYFMCGKKDIPELTLKAKEEAEQILREFCVFFRPARPISIEIYTAEHPTCYSIGARLIWDGVDVIRDENTCDLLFIDLNNLILKRMLELGFPSMGKEPETNGA